LSSDKASAYEVRQRGEVGGELSEEESADVDVALEEGALVEALATEPGGDLVVALAGVARAAGGDDVVERVATAPRQGQHAVLLQRLAGDAAVGAPAPGVPQSGHPLTPVHPEAASLLNCGV
jgi:hypothetical protein